MQHQMPIMSQPLTLNPPKDTAQVDEKLSGVIAFDRNKKKICR